MPLILDTFNVLHTVGVLPPDLAELDVPGLASLILRSRYASEKVTFACDGLPTDDLPPQGLLAVQGGLPVESSFLVRYSGRQSTADDLIRLMVDASTAPRRLIVVSSDHAIQKHASRRRCVVLASPDFLQQLADDADLPQRAGTALPRRPTTISPEQVEGWKSVFRIDDEVMAALAPTSPASAPSLQKVSDAEVDPSETRVAELAAQTPPLPDDLIAQAEALWTSAMPKSMERSQPQTPMPTPSTSLEESSSRANHDLDKSHADRTPTANDLDPDSVDMNQYLPQDGRTQRHQMPKHRRRPE